MLDSGIPRRFSIVALIVFLVALPFLAAEVARADGSPDVVISQIYGGAGGGASSAYPSDYVELFNRGPEPVSIDGWSLQYAGATSDHWQVVPLQGEIPPGGYYLIEGGPRNVASPVEPAIRGLPDISASRGKLALVSDGITLACADQCNFNPAIRDFVGWGEAASDFEGVPAPAGSGGDALVRKHGGAQDTDVNGDDFTTASPAPRNDVVPDCALGTVIGVEATISEIQGAGHLSPLEDQWVADVTGIVTAVRSDGFYLQDPDAPPSNAVSAGIFVFTNNASCLRPGDKATVGGQVREFRRDPQGLTMTEIVNPTFARLSRSNPLPAPVVIGNAGRVAPPEVFANTAGGNVELGDSFDPSVNAIDFYESLEGMRVQIDDAVVVGPTGPGGELVVLPDSGSGAEIPSAGGGVVATTAELNPDRVVLDDEVRSTPDLDVGARFQGPITGVLEYDDSTYRVDVTDLSPSEPAMHGLDPLPPAAETDLSIATLNVHNLDPSDGDQFRRLAEIIVDDLGAPDIIALEEIQDDNGEPDERLPDDAIVTADITGRMLITAIHEASWGQTSYRYVDVDPEDDQDGGAPGGNIRIGFLFRPDRVSLIDQNTGDATTPTELVAGPDGLRLTLNPGRVDPLNPAFVDSRKPLAALFAFGEERIFVIANHFASKGPDAPLFGPIQPPPHPSERQRVAQANAVNAFVTDILAQDASANIVVLGDFNDFEYSDTLSAVAGDQLFNMTDFLPPDERYSYVFQGNSQSLDHLLLSEHLAYTNPFHRIIHVNAEFADQASDHDPQLVRLPLGG